MTSVLRPAPFFNVGLPVWVGRTDSFPAGDGEVPAGGEHFRLAVEVGGDIPSSSPVCPRSPRAGSSRGSQVSPPSPPAWRTDTTPGRSS